tara:strand:- start:8078 stop:8788 length:711 start_codon:yes stop_codon:yes gene_type:complete
LCNNNQEVDSVETDQTTFFEQRYLTFMEIKMTGQTYTAEENLAYIREIMQKTRKRTTSAGSFLAVWGSLSAIVTFFQYLAVVGTFPLVYMPYLWAAFVISGVSFSILKGRQLAREKGEPCGDELITTSLFSSIGISLGVFFFATLLAGLLGLVSHIGTEVCYVISLVMAIAFYASSYSTGITWFRLVAYGWWAAVILFVLKPFAAEYLLLIIAVLDFLLLALPGFKLMSLAKHDQT